MFENRILPTMAVNKIATTMRFVISGAYDLCYMVFITFVPSFYVGLSRYCCGYIPGGEHNTSALLRLKKRSSADIMFLSYFVFVVVFYERNC